MAAKALASLAISPTGDGYLLMIEDEDGETIELTATFEQLDLIAEAVDQQLNGDEEDALSIDEDDE
ncbi:hypothetical protein COC42_09595 [Sphingomonas spermidinifaciens]|uniref:DUF1292 domain-containing protein n=1 Tax=Sphingomonas spermidinifaciens TaxID=1141889 RepID=A0A2A4B962_9SPHN|nr:hypothetical protein [Sphingomonas spermidinifaciens]PCD04492.1 hypothetical protein COC42_09595 [Sphingomonas spermidinifaciens]